jgi:hypothetical protein
MKARWEWKKHDGHVYFKAFHDDVAHEVGHVVVVSNGREAGDQIQMRFIENRLLRYYLVPAN